MADIYPQFDTRDIEGSTVHYNGTATTTASQIPSVPDKVISDVLIENLDTTPLLNRLLVSFDGGVTFKAMRRGQSMAWSLRGLLTSFVVKAETGTCAYEAIVNYEPF